MTKIRFLPALLAAACLASTSVHASTPHASTPHVGTPRVQHMEYSFYTGGLEVISAAFDIARTSPQDYTLSVSGQTKGIASFITDWEGRMTTRGRFENAAYPAFHKSVSLWPDNTQVKEVAWSANGDIKNFRMKDEGKVTTLEDIDSSLAQDSVDIVTAAFAIMKRAAASQDCEAQSTVFDGKRRFLIRGKKIGIETLTANKYNRYSGEALKCEIHVVPQGGEWKEKLRGWMSAMQKDREKSAPVVWLARIGGTGPAVPVKLLAKTPRGAFMMHLQGYRAE